MANAQQTGHRCVTLGLRHDAVARVDKQNDGLGGGHTGDGVSGVLLVTRAVGEDERADVGGEVAVGDVDGDALLTLGPQTIDQQREVGIFLTARLRGGDNGLVLVSEDVLRVVQQATDEGGLTVVDGASGAQAKSATSASGAVSGNQGSWGIWLAHQK